MQSWHERLFITTLGVGGAIVIPLLAPPLFLSNVAARPAHASQPSCPMELTLLVDKLLLALPAYANRAIQRQTLNPRPQEGFALRSPQTYVLLAGQPQIEPIANPVSGGAPLYQVFFTTLERQYLEQQSFDEASSRVEPQEFQQFHQLVLAQTKEPSNPAPWQVIRLRSQLAPYPAKNKRLSPLRNADQSPIAQAMRLWLRDCFRRNAPATR